MDRTINVKVGGSYINKDGDFGGVQGEANSRYLRIEFDSSWDGYAKTVTFWNALKENPVKRTLTADLLENLAESTSLYLCAIPGEALTDPGRLTFVIDGYLDGKRARSLEDTLKVKAASIADDAGEPADPTPSQAEQLQGQIDTLLPAIQAEAKTASDSAASAKESAEAAAISESNASTYAGAAKTSEDVAKASQSAAAASAQAAATSEINAEAAQAAAEKARDEAAEIAGGDFATNAEAQAMADAAEAAANKYTDEKVGSVDVSSQINVHNTATDSHTDIRQAASTAQSTADTAISNAETARAAAAAAQSTADDKVSKAGGTMTGALTLSGDPYEDNHAATKKYVDDGLGNKADADDALVKYVDGALTTSGGAAVQAGMSMVKVWENADLSSEFLAQTVPLDMTQYDAIMIVSQGCNTANQTTYENQNSPIIPKDGKAYIVTTGGISTGFSHRQVSVTNAGVTFTRALYRSNAAFGSNNGSNNGTIPQVIYGIKGVF